MGDDRQGVPAAKRDRRTLAMLIVLPVLLLVVFGYAARKFRRLERSRPSSSDRRLTLWRAISVSVRGRAGRSRRRQGLASRVSRTATQPSGSSQGRSRSSHCWTGPSSFSSQAAENAFAHLAQVSKQQGAPASECDFQILYNPHLKTSWIMIPGLTGLILLMIGTLITSLGIVRERQAGRSSNLRSCRFGPGT